MVDMSMSVQLLLTLFLSVMLSPGDVEEFNFEIEKTAFVAVDSGENRWTVYGIDEEGDRQPLGVYVVKNGVVDVPHGDHAHQIDMHHILAFDQDTDWDAITQIAFSHPDRHGQPIQIERDGAELRLAQNPPTSLLQPMQVIFVTSEQE